MPIQLWREVMEVNLLTNGDAIADELIKEFGAPFFKGSTQRSSPLWYADQSLVSYKLDKWRNQSTIHNETIEEHVERPRRIDRPRWGSYNFTKINITDYDDSHLINNIQVEGNWNKVWPLFKIIWKNKPKRLRLLEEYKSNYVKAKKKVK